MIAPVLAQIARRAARTPDAPAIGGGAHGVTYGALSAEIDAAAAVLRADDGGAAALALDNGAPWAIADLALLAAARPCLPLPPFFSPEQIAHALRDAGATLLVTDRAEAYAALLDSRGIAFSRQADLRLAGRTLACFALDVPRAALPAGTAKVTYTSGTTGAPKGVCLGADALSAVAASLAHVVSFTPDDRHLALLPLATLLENVAGLYAPLCAGACTLLPPLGEIGLASGAQIDMARAARKLAVERATTAITVPELLTGLCAALELGVSRPGTLRFLAVGGARVADALVSRAAAVGLPAYEGYGLTECASVAAVNTPDAQRAGSVGRVLPHAAVRVEDGEIHVRGATLLGYARGERFTGEWYPTGDYGRVDDDGFLYVTGRRKNVFITSYGRNVSPEWVESELTAGGIIAQAWVYGESLPSNFAVLTPRPGAGAREVDAALAAANARLPDYARVARWIPAVEPFSTANAQLTPNGRLRRAALIAAYRHLIPELYGENTDVVLR